MAILLVVCMEDIPGGEQLLCYNEIATKQNWYYLRLDVDLANWTFGTLQCNNRVYDLSPSTPCECPQWRTYGVCSIQFSLSKLIVTNAPSSI